MGLNESGYENGYENGHRAGYGGVRGEARKPAAETSPRSFRIDIGELVLDGFDSRVDPARVTAAFETELARLVHERGVPLAADGTGLSLDALGGLPPLPATTHPVRLGEALARAVHAGLAGRGDAR